LTVTGSGLLSRLEGVITLLGKPADQQKAWADVEHVGIEEMILQFFDFVPGWLDELRKSSMIDDSDELALLRLYVALDLMRRRSDLLEKWSAVANSEEWKRARQLSASALLSLRRSRPIGPPGQQATT